MSNVVINPVTGKFDPEIAEYLLPLVNVVDDSVAINEGLLPGDAAKMAAFADLSPILRLYPRAHDFTVTWSVMYPNYYMSWKLRYNREIGVITEIQTWQQNFTPLSIKVLGRNVTDRDIHEAAKSGSDYDKWAARNWAK